ncbi:MAG TPA: hypothetical protein K8V54_05170 [Corynebacterium kroppenstedtii]|nr:hypothetical protein [Corynebacterium kroppenstedtii]
MQFNKIIIAATLAVTAAASPAIAAADEVNDHGVSVENGKQIAKPLSSAQSAKISEAITRGELTLHTDPSNLSLPEAKAATNSNGETLVIVPIRNEGTEYSNLSVVFSESGNIAGYSEAHFFEKTATSGHVTAWSNGDKVEDEDVSASQSEAISPRSAGDAISELNRCLSAAGIPAWVVAAATAVCSFGSLPGYIACLTAAGVGGGTAGYCGASAWDKL